MFRIALAASAAIVALLAIPAAAQRGVTADCAGAWGRYQAAQGPKAFANGSVQGCGWQIKTDAYPTPAAIRAQALRQCAEKAGPKAGCRIVDQSP